MYTRLLQCSLILLTTICFEASAATIQNDRLTGVSQVNYFEPIGQSFTAIDSRVEAGIHFEVINPSWPNDDMLQYALYEGNGTAGTELATATFSLADGFTGYHIEDFSHINLTIGNVYSLVVSVLGDSPYWGVTYGRNMPGSSFIENGTVSYRTNIAIYVNGVSAVPIPAAVYLFGTGLLTIMGFSKKKISNTSGA